MKILKQLLIIFIFSGFLSSCQTEYFKSVPLDPNAIISFKTDLQPILTKNCAGSKCHDGSVSPNLMAGKAYNSLIDGGLVDPTLAPKDNILIIKIKTNMPAGGLQPTGDREKFIQWIKQGALDN